MIGTLTREQCEHVLHSGLIGRLGCHDQKSVYIVPVTYVYENGYIYVHSREGQKIQMMRKHPEVCFEVDSIESMTNWRCVVVQGRFEELTQEPDWTSALQILKDKLMPFLLSETMRPRGLDHDSGKIEKNRKPVVYRVRIEEMSGRFEKNHYGFLPE